MSKDKDKDKEVVVNTVAGLGSTFAIILSWTKWHSFWWAILHWSFGWFYVIYYFIKYQ